MRGKQPGGAHVGARKADLGEEERDARGGARRCGGPPAAAITAPAPATVPFSAATIGPPALAHREHQVAGHARELEQARVVATEAARR